MARSDGPRGALNPARSGAPEQSSRYPAPAPRRSELRHTAVYFPLRRQVDLLWSDRRLVRNLDDFEEAELPLHFDVA